VDSTVLLPFISEHREAYIPSREKYEIPAVNNYVKDPNSEQLTLNNNPGSEQ
jgi:hypothetical protein